MRLSFADSTAYHPLVMIEVIAKSANVVFSVYAGTNKAIDTAKTLSLNFQDSDVAIRGPIDRFYKNGKLVHEIKSAIAEYDDISEEERRDYKLLINDHWV